MEQKKYESDMTKKEKRQLRWQTIRSLKGKKKISYLWTYYKSWLGALALILLALAILFTSIRNLSGRELISIAVIDTKSETEDRAGQLREDLLEALGSGRPGERVTLDTSAGGGDNYMMASKRMVIFGSGTTDAVICSAEVYDAYQKAFKSWRELLGEQYEQYSQYLEDGKLDLSRSRRWQDYGLVEYEPAYLAVMYDTEREEEILRLLEFFF